MPDLAVVERLEQCSPQPFGSCSHRAPDPEDRYPTIISRVYRRERANIPSDRRDQCRRLFAQVRRRRKSKRPLSNHVRQFGAQRQPSRL